MQSSPYTWLMLLGIAVSLAIWYRNVPRRPGMITIYFSALVGAFLGAKVVYLLAEGWLHWNDPNRWAYLATGKSILGALFGGYAGVEIAKRSVGYRGATGDWFATITPFSIILGRIGCLLHGCCLGTACAPAWYTLLDRNHVNRWPAVPLEIAFNLTALLAFFWMRKTRKLPGQHFHLYLIAYGIFRFAHEIKRDTPRILGPFSGYQIAAAALVIFGCIRFYDRQTGAHRNARRAF
jgi:phosphatidylglycerol:prolipoprotein diacylglycerol transferase